MKHLFNITRILFWQAVDLVVIVVGLFIVPLAIPFRREIRAEDLRNPYTEPHARLPKWAWPWDNGDEGVYGDHGWRTEHRPDDWSSFKAMYLWLAIRNPAFEFGKRFGGINGIPVEKRVVGKEWGDHRGSPEGEVLVDNHPDTQGMAYRELYMEDDLMLAQYSLCKMYPWSKTHGFRFQIGPFIQAVQPEEIGKHVSYGHSVLIQPWKRFT